MAKYNISVMRYQSAEFEIEAESFEEARDKAVDHAYNTDWSKIDNWYQTANENGIYDD